MTTAAYQQLISAPPRDRLGLFLATANRLGTPIGNVGRGRAEAMADCQETMVHLERSHVLTVVTLPAK
jgi:hypothetical protein